MQQLGHCLVPRLEQQLEQQSGHWMDKQLGQQLGQPLGQQLVPRLEQQLQQLEPRLGKPLWMAEPACFETLARFPTFSPWLFPTLTFVGMPDQAFRSYLRRSRILLRAGAAAPCRSRHRIRPGFVYACPQIPSQRRVGLALVGDKSCRTLLSCAGVSFWTAGGSG